MTDKPITDRANLNRRPDIHVRNAHGLVKTFDAHDLERKP